MGLLQLFAQERKLLQPFTGTTGNRSHVELAIVRDIRNGMIHYGSESLVLINIDALPAPPL
jgi:hypothetical protein